MTHLSTIPKTRRRTISAVVVSITTAFAVIFGAVPASANTTGAASWLSTQLSGAPADNFGGDVGLTADGYFAFKAAGFTLQEGRTASWLEDDSNINAYLGTGGANHPGSLAKIALVAIASGDPGAASNWGTGGIDLISRLKSTLVTSGPDAGRFADPRDTPTYFGYANPTTQALAIIAIQHEDPTWAGLSSATSYLRGKTCTDNGWTWEFPTSSCAASDPDTTAVAVQALAYVAGSANNSAASAANVWLAGASAAQGANGAAWYNICQSPWTTPAPSVNSTALAVGGLLADPAGPSTYATQIADGITWLNFAQAGNGSQPACTATGSGDVRATTQGVLGLAGTNYLNLL